MRPLIERGPSFFFKLSMGYAVGLLTIALAHYNNLWGVRRLVDDPVAGVVPLGVPWSGALGAVMISLLGIFRYNGRWDPSYNYWHFARPLTGAVLGTWGFLFFLIAIQSTGEEPEMDTVDGSARNLLVYFVVAFIVGYREETFRELLKRAADLLLRPSGDTESAGATTLSANPTLGAAPLDVTFEVGAGATTASWSLDFGDNTPPLVRYGRSGEPISHTYAAAGTYTAALTAKDADDKESVARLQIVVTTPTGAGSPVEAEDLDHEAVDPPAPAVALDEAEMIVAGRPPEDLPNARIDKRQKAGR